jgi:hypothetical protein
VTSNTYLPDDNYRNTSQLDTIEDAAMMLSSHVTNTDRKMIPVLYVNPILQLMSLSNSAINPLCYCVMSHAVKHVLTVIRQKLRRRGQNNKTVSLPLSQRPMALNQSMKVVIQPRNSFVIDNNVH